MAAAAAGERERPSGCLAVCATSFVAWFALRVRSCVLVLRLWCWKPAPQGPIYRRGGEGVVSKSSGQVGAHQVFSAQREGAVDVVPTLNTTVPSPTSHD